MAFYRRQTIFGYLDMGKPQIPPLPQNIVMTDRVTGEKLFLTHTGIVGSLVLNASPTLPKKPDTVFYGPHAGPYLNGTLRLYLFSGTLLVERISPADYQIGNQRVLTRLGNERTFIEVTADDDGSLIFTEVSS